MRVPQADEAAADPVVAKPVDSVTTVDAAVATPASASAQAEPAGHSGYGSAAGAAQFDMAGAGAEPAAGATKTADVITPGSTGDAAHVEAMPSDAVVAQEAAAALPDPQMAGSASATAATALDQAGEETIDAALPVPAAAEAVPADRVADPAVKADSGPQLGSAATQSAAQTVAADADAVIADQPLFAGTGAGAVQATQEVSDSAGTAAAAAVASDPAAGEAAFVQQPGMFGAQQRRQVVARLPGRRRGHEPLSEAQQRLQRQWQARQHPHRMSHGCIANACHLIGT